MKTKYDIKINSVYIEFEPVTKVTWSLFRQDIMNSMSEYDVNVVTWETGTTIDSIDLEEKEN